MHTVSNSQSLSHLQASNENDISKLLQIFAAPWITQSVYVVCSLGIADILKDDEKDVEEISSLVSCNASSLYRILRCLASMGIFAETKPKTFKLTGTAQYLRADHPNSLRSLSMMLSDEWHWCSWGDVLHVVKTGEPAIKHLYGVDNTFNYLKHHPKSCKLFQDAMTNVSQSIHAEVVDVYDFSNFKKIVDVGGGFGALLSSILIRNPHMEGILFDLPHITKEAEKFITNQEFSNRCQTVAGNFFESIPITGDLYMMSHIIHDWDDEDCIQILKNIRKSISSEGRLIIIEAVIPSGNEPHFGKLLDLDMLIMYPKGRERTLEEFSHLFQVSGFKLNQIIPTNSHVSIIEAVCIP